MICPMKFNQRKEMEGHTFYCECEKEECAWWIQDGIDDGFCAIKNIGLALDVDNER